MTQHYIIYKTIHKNGKYYIGRHQTKTLCDGYFGSGKWVISIKDTTHLKRETLATASSLKELYALEEYYIKIHYNDPLCMNFKLASIGVTSEDISGDKHPQYDHTNHHFVHISGNEYIGTRYNFREKFNISNGLITKLMNGDILSAKGWRIFGSPESPVLQRINKIYHFVHEDGTEFIGTRKDFRKKYPTIKRQYIDFVVSGKGKSFNGWRLYGVEQKNSIKIYSFKNKDGRAFKGTCVEFRKKFNINQGNLSRLVRNDPKVLTIKGWFMLPSIQDQ